MTTRDERFMQSAEAWAGIWSKDPSTKVGACAVGDTPNLVAFGYNGFPPGIADTPERLADRDTRLALTIHAEPNALANATFPVRTLYVTRHPCERCALVIASCRTVRRVVYRRNEAFEARWAESAERARSYLEEAGIKLEGI
jgi:dCMP deaminase